MYFPFPSPDYGTGLGYDNCASFAIDVIATGKTDVGTSFMQTLASPSLSIQAANLSFGGSDFKGSI